MKPMSITEPFTDRELRCERCAQRFIWQAHTQAEFFLAGKFVPPSSCGPCRRARRAQAAKDRQAQLDAPMETTT
jgi:hypothetical protein